jgi:putative spermidine/putrescine transport system permease protein
MKLEISDPMSKLTESAARPSKDKRKVRGKRLKSFLFLFRLSPALFFIVLTYTSGLLSLFIISFYRYVPSGPNIMEKAFILKNYARFLGDPFYLNVLWTTFRLSLIITLVCLVIGYPIAYVMVRTSSRFVKRGILIAVFIPFLVAILVRIFSWMILLAQEGLINNLLVSLKLITEQNKFQFMGNEYGTIIGLSYILLPFMVFTLAGVLKRIDRSVEEAAQNLGANKVQTFIKVTLPLSMPAISAGSLLVFTLGISAFAVPLLLGGASDRMISNYIYDSFLFTSNYPFGAAMAFILLFIALAIVILQMRLLQTRKMGGD